MHARRRATIGAFGVSFATVLGVAGVVSPAAAADAPVTDPNLLACLIAQSDTPGATSLTVDQLSTITTIVCSDVGDLSGLEGATSLADMMLFDATLTSLAPLTDISTLISVYVDGEGPSITDLSPLADSPVLDNLTISHAPTTSLAAVASMPRLTVLELGSTQATGLAPVSALAALDTLRLWGSQVTDLAPLRSLSTLKTLAITGGPLSDLSPLSSMTSLVGLTLDKTAVSDLRPITGNADLNELNFAGAPVSTLDALRSLTNLRTINSERAAVTDVSPLNVLPFANLAGQQVDFGSVVVGATVLNPLRGFQGELLVPGAASLAGAGATLSADLSELVFSAPGVHYLTWESTPDPGPSFYQAFSGTIAFTVTGPRPPVVEPELPVPPVAKPDPPAATVADPAPAAPAPAPASSTAVLAATGTDLEGWLVVSAGLLIAGGAALIRVRRRA